MNAGPLMKKFISKYLLAAAILLSVYASVKPEGIVQDIPTYGPELLTKEYVFNYLIDNAEIIKKYSTYSFTNALEKLTTNSELSTEDLNEILFYAELDVRAYNYDKNYSYVKDAFYYLKSMPISVDSAPLGGYATKGNALRIGTKLAVVAAIYGAYKLYQKFNEEPKEEEEEEATAKLA